MKTRIVVLFAAALVAWGLKRHYADAPVDDLAWILRPTAGLVGWLTGAAFVAVPGEGFVSRERLFAIEKVCAGVNFMIAAFALIVLAWRHRARSPGQAAALLASAVLMSYGTAVVVNTARITIAMWLAAHPASLPASPAQVHRVEGVVVYFAALLLLYEIVQRLDRRPAVTESRAW